MMAEVAETEAYNIHEGFFFFFFGGGGSVYIPRVADVFVSQE